MQSPSLTRFAWLSIAAALATMALKGVAYLLTGPFDFVSNPVALEIVLNRRITEAAGHLAQRLAWVWTTVPVPVVGVDVAWSAPQVDQRIAAYRLLLERPAPCGVRVDAPRAWLGDAEAACRRLDSASAGAARERVERWLAAESRFAMGPTTTFLLQAGFDWYGKTRIEGHDTAYLPSGDNVNPRNDYTWSDADGALGQPRWEVVAMMGIRFRL